MSKKGKEWNIFILIVANLTMIVLGLIVAAGVTLVALLVADHIYFEMPSFVAPKQQWRFRQREFWSRVNWIFAGVVFGVTLIGFWLSLFGKDLKKWLGTRGVS